MRGKIVFNLTLCSAVFYWPLASAQNQPPSPETVRLIESIQGPALYKAYCAVCHGSDGKGGGPMTQSLKVRPADLTRISARNGGNFPIARVERIIAGTNEQLPAGRREKCHYGDRSSLKLPGIWISDACELTISPGTSETCR